MDREVAEDVGQEEMWKLLEDALGEQFKFRLFISDGV
jgi:hypothetical protein